MTNVKHMFSSYIVLLLSASSLHANDLASEQFPESCGAYALFHLFRLEGVEVSDSLIRSALPRLHPDGYSMKELREAAATLGLQLQGVNLQNKPGAVDRPMLALLQMEDHGHYVVIRPIGHTGRLIQVIDNFGDPSVLDSSALFSSSQWTGNVLIPRRTNWTLVAPSSILIIFFGLKLISRLKFRAAKLLQNNCVRRSALDLNHHER